MSERLRIKICGLTRNEDARLAEGLGADFLGLVLSEGFGRTVPRDLAASVVEGIRASTVAVLVDEPPATAADLARRIGASVIQLHGDEPVDEVEELRRLGAWRLWKAVRADTVDDLRRMVDRFGRAVDGFLVEGWREGVVGGGGVALRLEPAVVRGMIPSECDFVLAGGLTPESVGGAVARFGPDVVDVSSGVERSARVKDSGLVKSFIEAARLASFSPEA
ncbi:MAG: phosphoribosylanthranilate isomerase [Gemmatimonadetes bacterium]|nr:phosphoribosylanthranilate isomerase [Gemmatimonadota bacterium]